MPSNQLVSAVVMKNWLPFVPGPELAIDNIPIPRCFSIKFSKIHGNIEIWLKVIDISSYIWQLTIWEVTTINTFSTSSIMSCKITGYNLLIRYDGFMLYWMIIRVMSPCNINFGITLWNILSLYQSFFWGVDFSPVHRTLKFSITLESWYYVYEVEIDIHTSSSRDNICYKQ